jgi:Zn-dependent protease with chaperone function
MKPIAALAVALVLLPAMLPAQSSGRVAVSGYAEFRQGDVVIVDGQRVRATPATQFRGGEVRSLTSIPLGYEVKAEGTRQRDGVIVATAIDARPNGTAFLERDVTAATDAIEATWLKAGAMYEPTEDGGKKVIGWTISDGPEHARVRAMVDRLLPPYIEADRVRVHLVDTKEWNAAAMSNGAVWVYTGLVRDLTRDELAIVIGHEIGHFTHEHSRLQARRGLWTQIVGLGALLSAEAIDNDAARLSTQLGTLLGVTAFTNGYSRELEDQADRVGLRYAHEAGYDVHQGPVLWGKFRDKYGESARVTTFFFGSHSRPTDRIRNIQQELATNYARR